MPLLAPPLQNFTGVALIRDMGGLRPVESVRIDETEHKQAEAELRETRTRLQYLLAVSPAVIYTNQVSGDFPCTFVSENFQSIMGHTPQEMLDDSRFWVAHLHPHDAPHVLSEVNRLIPQGGGTLEYRFLHREGHYCWIHDTFKVVPDETGRPVEIIGSWADITDLKRAEAQNAKLYEQVSRYAQELEQKVEERTRALKEAQEELVKKEKLAVLGQLAGGVGHEIRNPLGVMKNSIYYLRLRLQDADEKAKRHLSIMEREIAIANKITTDLLDFSRTKEPSRVSTNLNELVQETLAQYPVEPQIELRTALDPRLPPAMIDKDQIRQVFMNLILNAVQAMPQGGQLTVKSSVERGFVVVSFSDTGYGIPEENVGKIFQPLFTTKAKGLGLGLAVSKTLVEGNKGEIAVESQADGWTIFHVKFPIT